MGLRRGVLIFDLLFFFLVLVIVILLDLEEEVEIILSLVKKFWFFLWIKLMGDDFWGYEVLREIGELMKEYLGE